MRSVSFVIDYHLSPTLLDPNSVPCLYLWITSKLVTPWGVTLFSACTLAISLAAFSFYGARIKIKELLIHANKSSNN